MCVPTTAACLHRIRVVRTVHTSHSDINTLRILITTDNHIGYEERDPVRGDDSFLAFDEALGVAARQKVRCDVMPAPVCLVSLATA